jgi:predicted dehydrogenase
MKEIRMGVVGLGLRSVGWIHQLQRIEGFRITAICDVIPAMREQALSKIKNPGEVKSYGRYEDILADANVDAIALCVRAKNQGALAAQALRAGKHVNAEVPAAHTLEDCWSMVLAQEQSGCVYLSAEQTRYYGYVEAWAKLVAEGTLGHITYCEGQYLAHYGTLHFFKDPKTGRFYDLNELDQHPEARSTWLQDMPPIHYLPHNLSPMLKVLDDRVVEVTAMSTQSPSQAFPQINQPDIQVALMKTAKGTILRMLVGFTQPMPAGLPHQVHQVIGTKGSVELNRASNQKPKMWLNGMQMHDAAEVDWRYERTDAIPEAKGSGHGDSDYYIHIAFRDAVLDGKPLTFDVYRAIEAAAPAILAGDSIAQNSKLLQVPDFRPGESRPKGTAPR